MVKQFSFGSLLHSTFLKRMMTYFLHDSHNLSWALEVPLISLFLAIISFKEQVMLPLPVISITNMDLLLKIFLFWYLCGHVKIMCFSRDIFDFLG